MAWLGAQRGPLTPHHSWLKGGAPPAPEPLSCLRAAQLVFTDDLLIDGSVAPPSASFAVFEEAGEQRWGSGIEWAD